MQTQLLIGRAGCQSCCSGHDSRRKHIHSILPTNSCTAPQSLQRLCPCTPHTLLSDHSTTEEHKQTEDGCPDYKGLNLL
ncbi:hypothetical protein PAMP_024147 [Pampus punctatissimus]